MFIKNPETCDGKQQRSRVHVIVSIRTRDKVFNYVAGRYDQEQNISIIYEDSQSANFLAKNR